MAAMEERMIVSGGDEVRVFAPPKREPQEQIRLEGAGALCVSHGTVFCASDWGDTVWRLDAERLDLFFVRFIKFLVIMQAVELQQVDALCGKACECHGLGTYLPICYCTAFPLDAQPHFGNVNSKCEKNIKKYK